MTAFMLTSFQNCGNVKLEPKELPSIVAPQSKALPQGNVCSGTGALFGAHVRFSFIVDMSLSNLGGAIATPSTMGKYSWSLDLPNATDNPTDKNKSRFAAVKNFISTCGNSAEFKYSIIGFSDNAMFGVPLKTCNSDFESASEAIKSIDGLKAIQERDLITSGIDYVSPYKMANTEYNKGLSCLADNINNDAATYGIKDSPIYQTFFLTDGQPTDFAGDLVKQLASYKSSMNSIIDFALPFSSGIKMNTIYYGPDEQKANATALLDAIAQTTDPLAKTDYVDNFPNLATKLCDLYKPQATYAYRSYQAIAINLNRVQYENNFEVDSDGDGISDKEEIKLGFDPLNPRTKGVLDSLCIRAGFTVNNCVAPPGCTQDYKGFALTDCDIKFASTYFGKTLTGFDTDGDQIIDFIEIIRGTNPVVADMQNDIDKDGINNIREIIDGSGVNNKAKLNDTDLIKFSWTKSNDKQSCSSPTEEKYAFNFMQAPVAAGLNYVDKLPGKIDFSHKGEENVYLVLYLTEPRGSSTLPKRLNAIKITVSSETNPVVGKSIYFGDFIK